MHNVRWVFHMWSFVHHGLQLIQINYSGACYKANAYYILLFDRGLLYFEKKCNAIVMWGIITTVIISPILIACKNILWWNFGSRTKCRLKCHRLVFIIIHLKNDFSIILVIWK